MGAVDVLRRRVLPVADAASAPVESPAPAAAPAEVMRPGESMAPRRAVNGPISLAEALRDSLTTIETRTYLGDSVIHASSLHGMCSMHRVLQRDVQRPQTVTASDRMRWDIGHAVQAWVSNKYLGPMGRLWGEWRCVACRGVVTGQMPPTCACGSKVLRYEEREIVNTELGIVAHLDGFDLDPFGTLRVLEIKTADGQFFKYRLKEPLAEHVWRTRLYMWMAGLDEGIILYVSMAYESRSPFREFVVQADHAAIEADVRRLVGEVREGGRRVCDSPMAIRATGCPVRAQCWGLLG